MTTRSLRLMINGVERSGSAEDRMTLADFLRDRLHLTGTHLGCEHGVCGACTVLLDGRSIRSCLMLAAQCEEHEITTIEGLSSTDEDLHPLQRAFSQNHGLQCGFCTPGMIMTACELLDENPEPNTSQVRDHLSGNLCRCTGYIKVFDAVECAARIMQREQQGQSEGETSSKVEPS